MSLEDDIATIVEHIRQADRLAQQHSLGNIFYNEGYVDLLIAQCLGHRYNAETQGPDAYADADQWCEYKAINVSSGKPPGSFQFHWLSKPKIEKYRKTSRFFFAVRNGTSISEIWSLDASVVVPLLEAKAREKGPWMRPKRKQTLTSRSRSVPSRNWVL